MNNFIDVYFKNQNEKYKTKVAGYQWDKGQILRLHGLDLPATTEFQIVTEYQNEAKSCKGTNVNGVWEVMLPDFVFNQDVAEDYKVVVYIFVIRGDTGTTEHIIDLIVRSRPRRGNI